MTPADRIRVKHMVEHADEAIQLACGRQRTDLDGDRTLNLALVRLLEIVGEAAARVSSDAQQECPQVPWKLIVGMRNRLIHGYDVVDFDVLWHVIEVDLPPLVADLRQIVTP